MVERCLEERQPHLQPVIIQAPHPMHGQHPTVQSHQPTIQMHQPIMQTHHHLSNQAKHQAAHTLPYNRRIIEMQQPIYDRLPSQNRPQPLQQPVYAQVDKTKQMLSTNAHFQRFTPHRQSLDQISRPAANQPIYYQQPVFVRQSPQRSTVSGVYRGSGGVGGVSGVGGGQMHPQMSPSPIHFSQARQQYQLQQPPRPQSVMDEMFRSREAQPSPSPSVQLRRKPPINRNEIMNQVIEFCRKSMNRTPTNRSIASIERIPGALHKEVTSSEVSPISYASVATSKTSPSIASTRSGRAEPPGVPMRKQSLPQHAQQSLPQHAQHAQNEPHPIYESISRQRPVQMAANDQNQLNGYVSHYLVPSKKFVVMNSEQVTPAHVRQYQHYNGHGSNSSINQPIYNNTPKSSLDRIHLDTNNYEYIGRLPNGGAQLTGNNLLQVYSPAAMPVQRSGVGERKYGAPVLPTIPQHRQMNGTNTITLPSGYTKSKIPMPKPGSIVVVNDIEQMYRPIAATTTKSVRQRTSQASLDSLDSAIALRGHGVPLYNGELTFRFE